MEIVWHEGPNTPFQITTLPFGTAMGKCACIPLPANTTSALEWKEEVAAATNYVEAGYSLLWDFQFGLFDKLRSPLASSMQLQAFELAIDQFHTLIWEKFAHSSVGAFLYRGPLDLAPTFPWDATQENNLKAWRERHGLNPEAATAAAWDAHFCLDVAAEYLHLLAARLPFELEPYVVLEVAPYHTVLDEALLLNQERFNGLKTIATNSKLAALSATAPLGVCLPSLANTMTCDLASLEATLIRLIELGKPFRLITPELLSTQWNQLDTLLISSEKLSPSTKRMLQGFMAAGGSVLPLED